jgi:hypothetical protein
MLVFTDLKSDLVYLERGRRARSDVALEVKTECEMCPGQLAADDEAQICCYECAANRKQVCPNGGELVRRPGRKNP